MNRTFYLLLFLFISLSGCFKDQSGHIPTDTYGNSRGGMDPVDSILQNLPPTNEVLIINKGIPGSSNGTITLFKPQPRTVTNDWFFDVNNTSLGDLPHSITKHNNQLFITVTGSDKLEVVDPQTFISLNTIDLPIAPTHFLAITPSIVYITGDSLSVYDLDSMKTINVIGFSSAPSQMVLAGEKVFVLIKGSDQLVSLDATNDSIIDTINLVTGANSIAQDLKNKIWVLSDGGNMIATPALQRLDIEGDFVEMTLSFPSISDSPHDLSSVKRSSDLYFLNGDIFRINMNSNSLPIDPIAFAENRSYSAIEVHPIDRFIYAADTSLRPANGWVYIHNPSGKLVDSLEAGVVPFDFFMK
ncbi:MAG: hypothetical protein IH946_09575 [Bacteroidetes bacterium]|nr:hypothetical protein [Bacteroidota bacterium]